jgi:hypothetical protein
MSGSGRPKVLTGLLVYFTGSPRAAQWRSAMTGLAHARGWLIAEDDGTLELAERLASDQPALVFSSLTIPSQLAGERLQTAVVKDTPGAAMLALASDQSRASLIMAAYQGSALFAYAAVMARQGAVVLDANAPSLSLPLLGEVAAGPSAGHTPNTWRSLDIYDALPPPAGARANWPLEAFNYPIMTADGLVDTGRAAIDLTGRARTIVYGPYTYLPPGLWEVEVKVMIDPDGGAAHLRFEWGTNPEYVGSSASVTKSGEYRVRLQRFWSNVGPSEMRITTIQPHFHGRFELLSVSVRLLSESAPTEASL